MTAHAATGKEAVKGLAPFSLKDAPSFIEAEFPVGRLSAETYNERKAGSGQILTALGSYWKGRKPLVMVRAVVLGCLLPATSSPAKDLEVFLMLMGMDDTAIGRRISGLQAKDIDPNWAEFSKLVVIEAGKNGVEKAIWRSGIDHEERDQLIREWVRGLPYDARLRFCLRPDEIEDGDLLSDIWPIVNDHLGTSAKSIEKLVQELGVARFGRSPKVADTFCGGGSIPFESARIGCDALASDLNPIAGMLTWGAFNIIGADWRTRNQIETTQRKVASEVDAEFMRLGIETDEKGNRAKSFLYCLETRCPKTGWMVPMAPSWVISKKRSVIARLVPDHDSRRYDIEVIEGVSAKEMAEAAQGTVRDGRLIHPLNPERSGVEIKTIRGDYRGADGVNRNRLRPWEKSDFCPRPDDIWQERLYCIQWMTRESLSKGRQETFFAAVTSADLERENQVRAIVAENLSKWQKSGLVPDMVIEGGDKTDEPIRTRG